MNPKLLNIIKRRKKYISLHLDGDARSKPQTKNKTDIQLKIIEQMKLFEKNKLTKDIAVQIITYTTDKKTPGIDKWAKNIIDILHKPDYLEDSNNIQYLPFNDDKQIKYLLIKYIYTGKTTSTHIDILPFTGFISDLHLVDEINRNTSWDIHEDDNNYREILTNKDLYRTVLSEEAYNAMLQTSLEIEQRKFGDLISINSNFIRLCFPKKIRFYKQFEAIHQDWAELLLQTPIKLKLPGLPKNGSINKQIAKSYKNKIRELLTQYLIKYSFLKELQSPIIVSVIYRPEKNIVEKDIDNILLEYILPIVNDVLNPPASLYRITEFNNMDYKERIKVPLAKDKNGMSIGYEIVKVPQFSGKECGEIYLGFRFDSIDDTLIDECQSAIDEYIEENG